MAISYVPVTWWSGYLDDGVALSVEFATLDGVETGTVDIREVLLGLLNETEGHQDTLTAADTPTKFSITNEKKYDKAGDEIQQKFTVTFDLTPTTTLASE
jgi:hypothetical protein